MKNVVLLVRKRTAPRPAACGAASEAEQRVDLPRILADLEILAKAYPHLAVTAEAAPARPAAEEEACTERRRREARAQG